MKIVYLFFVLLLLSEKLLAQVVDPSPGLKLGKHVEKRTIVEKVIKPKMQDNKILTDNEGKNILDTSITEKKVQEIVTSRAAIYGLTSLNNANNDFVNSLNATGRIGAIFYLGKTRNFKVNLGVNMLNAKPPKGINKDSIDFNSLQFPETGNFGFMFSPSLRLDEWNENSLWLEGAFSYRRVSIDSPNISFQALSYNVGLKYQWSYLSSSDSNHVIFTLMPYGNFFNIPNEDVTRFKSLLNDPLFDKASKGAGIYSIGAKITTQYKNVLFFFDIRYNFATKDFNDDNPFKGTKVNIGFVTAFNFKSF